ncbi:MAG: hypothetical protein JOY54_01315 [Acidobacteriaceae bacterium]|nr:hypothetical protein [Acidobacteriaceae bacterium]
MAPNPACPRPNFEGRYGLGSRNIGSHGYYIARGTKMAHRRHWLKLAEMVGVKVR